MCNFQNIVICDLCLKKKKKCSRLPRVRIELTTFRLWDWRAAYYANEAAGNLLHVYKIYT